jgi:DnaJ-class molecular chaperone
MNTKTKEQVIECEHCDGDGYTVEMTLDGYDQDGCQEWWPVQVQCEPCKGNGTIEKAIEQLRKE